MLLWFFLILSVISGSYAYGDSVAEPKLSFSLPFYLGHTDLEPQYPEGVCLADSFPPGTEVSLVSHKGICHAKSLDSFRYQHPGGNNFQATVLKVTEECLGGAEIAVIGASAGAVRLIPTSDVQVPLATDMESKARSLLKKWTIAGIESQQRSTEVETNPLSNSPPQVATSGEITILTFQVNEGDKGFKLNGPIVIALHDRVFPLEGWCTLGHLLFSVRDRPYIACTAQCCGCGANTLYVYELAGPTPRQVYENGKFSD